MFCLQDMIYNLTNTIPWGKARADSWGRRNEKFLDLLSFLVLTLEHEVQLNMPIIYNCFKLNFTIQ